MDVCWTPIFTTVFQRADGHYGAFFPALPLLVSDGIFRMCTIGATLKLVLAVSARASFVAPVYGIFGQRELDFP